MIDRSLSLCVFCGSRSGKNPSYEAAAIELGTAIAAEDWRLVYGAGDVGLMGAVARATQKSNGTTFGVIPTHLFSKEVAKKDLSTYVVTENMHERKKVMFMNCDAIVVLPGGAGSLDEFFEVLTWKQIGLHDKPIYVLNVEGYWDKLNDLIAHIIDEGFASESTGTLYKSVATVSDLVADLRNFKD